MNTLQRSIYRLLLAVLPALACLLLLATPVYADDCLTDPWNAKDCMRTPGYKQFITTLAVALGVTEVALINLLAPFWQTLKMIDNTGKTAENLWNWLFNRFGRSAIRQQGANLASQTANMLNALNQPPTPPPPTPSPPPPTPPPVQQPNWAGAPTTKIIDSDSAGDPRDRKHQAVKILQDFKVWDDLKNLKPGADDYWQRMDDILRRAQNKDSRVQAIAFEHPKDKNGNDLPGILNDNVTLVVEEPEYGPHYPPQTPPVTPPPVTTPPTTPPVSPPTTPPPPTPPVSPPTTPPPTTPPVSPPTTPPPTTPPVTPPTTPPATPPPAPQTPPEPPPEMRPAPRGTPSGTSNNTFQDATPEQEKMINTAHEIAQSFTDNAISTLEAAKNAKNHQVERYFGIKGTTPEDIAKIDTLLGKFNQLQKQLQNGVSYEVDSYGPVAIRLGLPFDPDAAAYVYTVSYYGGVGDVHVVAPVFGGTGTADQARIVLHEVTHYTLATDDHAYAFQGKFLTLTQKQQFDNADSFADFARACS